MASGETNFASLPSKTSPSNADMFLLEDTEDTKKINYSALADAILNKLTSKTYSGLDTSAKNLVSAINELNSKIVDPIIRPYTYPNFSASNGQKVTIQIEMEKASNYYPICVYDTQFGESFLITNSWSSSNSISMQILNNSGKDVSGNISIILIKKNLN